MSLDYILDTLKNDLAKRGAYKHGSNLTALELSELLMNQYIRYPYPVADDLIPFNYCTLMKLYPITRHFLQFLCQTW